MANNRIAYGLCKRLGINLPDDATPKDAWTALKNIGIDSGKLKAKIEKYHGKRLPTSKKRRDFNMTNVEWAVYYNKLSSLKSKYGERYMNDGEIPLIKIDNKIILSAGTFEEPFVYEVIEISDNLLYVENSDD